MQRSSMHLDQVRGRRFIAALVALMVAFAGLIAAPLTALAAELNPSFDNVRVTKGLDPDGTGTEVVKDSKISVNDRLTFHADWSIPGSSTNGDTFKVPLPETFRIASSQPFDLKDDDGDTTLATCQYTTPATDILCTVVGGPHENLKGNIWFSGYLNHKEGADNISWGIDRTIVLPNPAKDGEGPYRPNFSTTKAAQGATIENNKANIVWALYMWPGADTPANGSWTREFHIADTLIATDESLPHVIDPHSFELLRYDRLTTEDGSAWVDSSDPNVSTGDRDSRKVIARYVDGVWTTDGLDGETVEEPKVAADGKSFEFVLKNVDSPHMYRLQYVTRSEDTALDGDKFSNTAELKGETMTVTNTAHVLGGGGANAGAYTSFSAKKQISGSVLPDGMPSEYVLKATQGEQTTTVKIPADGTAVNSPYFPVSGGKITLCEELPAASGINWGAYTISGEGVEGPNDDGCYTLAPAGGKKIEITVTNTFSEQAKVTVGDYTWIDSNRDGIQDEGEKPLPGVELTLTGPDGKPVTDVNGNPVGPQTTDENGKYLFTDLPVLKDGESYTVTVTKVPEGYFPTKVEAGDDRAVDSSGDKAVSHLPLTKDGDQDLTLDFGYVTYEPSISIVKKDAAGNDANDADSAVDLTESQGATGLVFTIANNGDEPLTNIVVSDEVTAGDATVENLTCVFPDDSEGTEWAGPFEVDASFECTADLSGVKADVFHTNNAAVTGKGKFTGKTVKDDDPYNAKVVETPPTDEPSTTPPPAGDDDEPTATPPADQPGDKPAPEQPGKKPGLALTGATTAWLAVAGAALVLGGVTLMLVRRRNAVTE